MEQNNKKANPYNKIKVENKEGLTVSYNKEKFLEHFPHLLKELSEKSKSIKINSIEREIEQIKKEKPQELNYPYPNELYNPGVIDFIRRCSTKEEAIGILDYLLNRNEITKADHESFKDIISNEGGLERLIDQSGGLKRPGYYMRKYYKNNFKNQKINSKKD